ncbi:endonuclease domain-containing protein [Paraburkholderia tropica]|uniref:endonuclease domain-containing protein n=1 Tax=Paraburkholderia tropica TaxID=92647 RepID=UPI0007FCF5DD|nr:DUF559 domain-containing protein [Paraburkholderia tropica]OBR52360.1 hypothetical protein A6456_10700 [Paraburkholderia tropica]
MNHPAIRPLDIGSFLADIRNPAYSMTRVHGLMPLSERFKLIRANYHARARMVADGKCDWDRGDPYRIADWPSIFTPIEAAAWGEIRGDGLPLWPQFPVGRYFVDFGNPVSRVALECDGKEFHDPKKDAQRDAELLDMGWTVYRAPGWKCMKEMTPPCELDEDDATDEYRAEFRDTTIRGLIQLIARNHFPERSYLEQ